MIFFIVLTLVRTREAWKRVITTFLLGGITLIPFIAYGVATGKGVWVDMTPLSTEGTRMLSAPHSFFVLTGLILFMNLYAHRDRRIAALGQWAVPLFTIGSLGILVGLFRNLWLGFAIATILTFGVVAREQRVRLLGLFLKTGVLASSVVMLAIAGSILFLNNFSKIEAASRPLLERIAILNPTRIEDSSTEFRAVIFKEGMRAFVQNPIAGVGFGRSIDVDVSDWTGEQKIRELHNTYAELAVQMGVVGLLAFGMMLVSLAREGRHAYAVIPQDMKPAMIGVVAFLITMLTITAFGTYFQTNMYLLFFWTFAALLVAPLFFEKQKDRIGSYQDRKREILLSKRHVPQAISAWSEARRAEAKLPREKNARPQEASDSGAA
ncbi:MAG: O-antigen ligase family protein [Candidatus Kerfeldbacteria bacterium]|nr:O-antigen ligase family protein [Candidatus Kerfeldbacteria bacterium]